MRMIFVLLGLATLVGAAQPGTDDQPKFTTDGRLQFPVDYREWVFLSSGIGMTYKSEATAQHDPSFTNVFAAPAAYKAFLKNGTWPDKTVLVLEVRASQSRGSINKAGHYQTNREAVEVEVKDEKRFPGKWAFFDFSGRQSEPVQPIPQTMECYSCHRTNTAVDNTFVQFYPTLLAIARQKGTVNEAAVANH